MKLEQFKAGSWEKQYQYKSFLPNSVNKPWIWDDARINVLLSEANLRLGELNAFSELVPDIDYFIKAHMAKEASDSSKIEGTKTEITEALMEVRDIEPERKDDWKEVHNYIDALKYALEALDKIPLSSRMLKKCHQILMSGVRGKYKTPGEYRRSQNWIGGVSLKDAVFVPPVHTEIQQLMGDLEKFLHNKNIEVPELIRIAIAHYQFETIHPFLDGNGRLGRLLITIYLINSNQLKKPTLYISDYFERYKNLYYDNLTRVRSADDIIQWIRFFLSAVTETSKKSANTLQKILALKINIENVRLVKLNKERHEKAVNLMFYLYNNPFIKPKDVMKKLKITAATANSLIKDLVKLKILTELTGKKRNRSYIFEEYVTLFIDDAEKKR